MPPEEPGVTRQPARPGLSVTQIVAGALTAVTTTLAMSYLGVLGTIAGAAVASVLGVLGNYIYTHSIDRTRQQVRVRRPARTDPEDTQLLDPVAQDPGSARREEAPTQPLERVATEPVPVLPAPLDLASPVDASPRLERRGGHPRRAILLAVAGLFVVILAAVTALELTLGRPLSDLVRGIQGSGTTVFGDRAPASPEPSPPSTTPQPPVGTTPAVPATTGATPAETTAPLPVTPPATPTVTEPPTATTTAPPTGT